jgi:DNA-binding transcriptional MerR regulator
MSAGTAPRAESSEAAGPAAPARPAPRKAPDAFRTISEVAEELDIPAHVLRFWESKFPQLSPLKRGGRRRYYRPADLELLRGIRASLYDEGLTIKGLQKVFRERGVKYVVAVGAGAAPTQSEPADAPESAAPASAIAAVIARLETLRDRLRAGPAA